MTAAPLAALYGRVSGRGSEDGYSLDEQERGCREYAERKGYNVVMAEREVADSTALSRPRLDAIREAGRRGEVSRIIVYVQDRLGRGADIIAVTLYLLQASGIAAECVLEPFGETALDKGLVAIRGMVSGMEKENIARRTQSGRRARARSGKLIPGNKPLYGFAWADAKKSAYVICPNTAPIVRRIYRELAGSKSIGAIAADLAADAIPSPSGGVWNRSTIFRIVTNRRYAGEAVAFGKRQVVRVTAPNGARVWRGTARPESEMIPLPAGTIPAIITQAEAAAVAGLLERNKANAVRNHRNPDAFLFRGFVYCGACGGSVGTTHSRQPVYHIPRTRWRHRECQRATIPAHVLDGEVWESLRVRLMDRSFIAQQIARHQQQDSAGDELAAVEQSLADVQRKQANLARKISAIDDDEASAPLVAELSSLGEQKRNLEARLPRLRAQRQAWEDTGRLLDQLDEWCELWRENLADANLELKRKILAALRVRVLLFPASRHPRWEIETDWSAALGTAEPGADAIVLRCSRSAGALRCVRD